jgi:uncharacterized membrane protein
MTFKHAMDFISAVFEVAGVAVIIIGAAWAFARFGTAIMRREASATRYQAFRRELGRAILAGLEVLVAADIIRTVTIDLTLASIGVLGLLVLIRTFLSWSLEVEIHGMWPWQRARELSQRATPQPAHTTTDTLEHPQPLSMTDQADRSPIAPTR